MQYNFDEIISRENTDCYKYDLRKTFFGNENVIPLWVADMDFAAPDFVRDAIIERATHPVYGYTFVSEKVYESLISWLQRRQDRLVQKDWITFLPGVVPSLNLAVLAFSEPGDSIIVQPPVYFPFFTAVKNNKREIIYNELKNENGTYRMDLDDLKKKITINTRMLLLCHPHNPAGRSWSREELNDLADICIEHKIIIISDEIHSDLMLYGNRHIPMASLSDDIDSITVTCLAPSKTFNLAGLSSSAVVIRNPELNKLFRTSIDKLHLGMPNIFGITALHSAYDKGDEWLDQLLVYLSSNADVVSEFINTNIPAVSVVKPEATYMAWLDFSKLGLSNSKLKKFIIDKAGLGLNDGPMFGPGGKGFQRLNFALPRQKLLFALENLEKAFH